MGMQVLAAVDCNTSRMKNISMIESEINHKILNDDYVHSVEINKNSLLYNMTGAAICYDHTCFSGLYRRKAQKALVTNGGTLGYLFPLPLTCLNFQAESALCSEPTGQAPSAPGQE